MDRQDVVRAKVQEIAERVALSEGLELVDVELHGRGPGMVVRVFLDKPGGVSHGDCQEVSRQLGTILDVEGVIDNRYTLEVSSPGLDRKLRNLADYQRFIGQKVSVLLSVAEGRRHFQGRLAAVQDGQISVELDGGQTMQLSLGQIGRANLVPEFPVKNAPHRGQARRNSR